ncbi:MAG: hypothetical protein LBH43_00750 [Treponema sp.]|jgi:hypothetical protein|nr:hypothetical protein [Treponema sp.]
MNRKNFSVLSVVAFLVSILFTNCTTIRHYDLSLNNTLAIFLLNNDKDYYFCIPVQYMGDYQIGKFEFVTGYILTGNYEIPLKRDELKITVYLNEAADLDGNSDLGFDLIYSEENGRISLSKMNEPLTINQKPIDKYNHYYIFIEKHLTDDNVKKIIREYKKGNRLSKFGIEYDIIIDNELQAGSGLLDDFDLYDGLAIDPVWFPPNLNFFKARYLQINQQP